MRPSEFPENFEAISFLRSELINNCNTNSVGIPMELSIEELLEKTAPQRPPSIQKGNK